MDIYKELKDAGAEIDSHESDLYVKLTLNAIKVLAKYKGRVVPFISEIDDQCWTKLPFQFTPFWEKKQAADNA